MSRTSLPKKEMSEKQKRFLSMVYKDEQGYYRWKKSKDRVHRTIAYNEIYLKNRKKYPLNFSEYQVHHKDKDIINNRVENLEVILPRVHEEKHGKQRVEWAIIKMLAGIAVASFVIRLFENYARSNLGTNGTILGYFVISSLAIIIIFLSVRETKKRKYI